MKLTLSLALLGAVTLCNILLMHDALTKTEQMHLKSLALVESSLNTSLRQAEQTLTLGDINLAQVEQVKSLMATMPIGK